MKVLSKIVTYMIGICFSIISYITIVNTTVKLFTVDFGTFDFCNLLFILICFTIMNVWLWYEILKEDKTPEVKKPKDITETTYNITNDAIVDINDGWVKVEDEEPPHEVVLAAIDTYDCGWVIHTAWWYKQHETWMTTGCLKSCKAHLEYTHWKRLPDRPKN